MANFQAFLEATVQVAVFDTVTARYLDSTPQLRVDMAQRMDGFTGVVDRRGVPVFEALSMSGCLFDTPGGGGFAAEVVAMRPSTARRGFWKLLVLLAGHAMWVYLPKDP